MTTTELFLRVSEFLGVIAVLLFAHAGGRLEYHPVNFQYPKREGKVSIYLIVAVLVISALFHFNIIPTGFIDIDAALNPHLTQLLVTLIALAFFILALVYRRQPPLSAGWRRVDNLKIGVRIGVLLGLLTIILRGKVGELINGIQLTEVYVLLITAGIVFAEETMFRGYLQLRLYDWLGDKFGWIVTSLTYVLWRVPLLLTMENFWLMLGITTVQSFLLSWVMKKSGHVTATAIYRTISDWLLFLP